MSCSDGRSYLAGMTRNAILSALTAAAFFALTGVTAEAQSTCLTPQQVNAAASAGQIVWLHDLQLPGKVLSFEVCDRGGQLFYEVTVDEGSSINKVVLNARTGRP